MTSKNGPDRPEGRTNGLFCRLLEIFARLSFRLYPRAFRESYEEEIRALHERLDGVAGGETSARMSLRMIAEAVRQGPAARLEHRLRTRPAEVSRTGGLRWDAIVLDIRRAGRQLRRRPLLNGLLVGTLALGIGSATAIFSVTEQVLLRPLDYEAPDRLVRFMNTDFGELVADGTIAYQDLHDWHERGGVFEGVVAFDEWGPILAAGGEVERISAATVGANYFDLLGIQPAAGRFFLPEEDEDGKDFVVVLSNRLWKRRFGAQPEVIGLMVMLDDRPHEVVGVAPPMEEPGLAAVDDEPVLWRPNGYGGLAQDRLPNRGSESWAGIGRLRDGVTLEQAQTEVQNVASLLEREYPESNRGRGVVLIPVHRQMVGEIQPSLRLLMGAVGLLFLVALVNVAGVLLGRATERARETAVSRALGAGRWVLLQRGVVEGAVLGSLGCLLGLALAWLGTRFLTSLAGHVLPRPVEAGLEIRPIAFAVIASLVTAAFCGILPTLLSFRTGLAQTLRAGAISLAGTRSSVRTRSLLVVAEVALSVVLLFGATFLGVGFVNLLEVDPGIEAENVLTFGLSVPRASHPDSLAIDRFYSTLEEQLRVLPGVVDVGVTNIVPLSGDFDGNGVWASDWPDRSDENELSAETRSVSSTYLSTMGVELHSGRFFDQPAADGEPEAIISHSLAEKLWPGGDPIDRFLISSADESRPARVVGVVADVKHLRLDEVAPDRVYLPRAQALVPWQMRRATVVLRTATDPMDPKLGMSVAVRQAVRSLDPRIPISEMRTMDQLIDRTISSPRLRTLLTVVFGAASLLLTALGIYSVISSSVTMRRREFAIRLALGAQRSRVASYVLAETTMLVAAGTVIGVITAWIGKGIVESLVYGLDGVHALAVAAVPVSLLLLVSVVASLSPALRASGLAPAAILKES